MEYLYNRLGDRIAQVAQSAPDSSYWETTEYTLDLNTGLTQVLSDGTTTYTYGLGRIAQVNTTEYFLGDALGSVRQMADVNGEITYARGYDPYGVVTYTTGASHTEFGFTGEQYGDSTQLLYLRARHYSPADGRFTSRDTWAGDYNRPLSLNRWNYVEGNPVNHTDPSGQCYIDTGNLPKWQPWKWEWKIWHNPFIGPCPDLSGPISPDKPFWHEYWANNPVCSAWLNCSREEVVDALSRFTFPGQNPREPVSPFEQNFVAPFGWFPGTGFEYLGAIRSLIFLEGLHVRNVSEPTHIFHKGQVDRRAFQVGKTWYVETHGTGNNIYLKMHIVNQVSGAAAFTIVDREMRRYLETNRLMKWIKGIAC